MVPFVVVQLDTRAKAIHAKVKICANSTSYDNQMSDIFAASVAVVFLAKVFDGSYNNTVRPPLNASITLDVVAIGFGIMFTLFYRGSHRFIYYFGSASFFLP